MNPCYSCFWGQDSTNIPSPMSEGEWCWVQSSLPASCIIPALLDVGFIWELITLWQARISMEGHKVSWFWWPAKALFTDMVDLFLRLWLHAPVCGKGKITLWWCELIWRYKSIPLLLCQMIPSDSVRSLQTHLRTSRQLHLPSLKLGFTTERILGLDSHTLTDKQLHRQANADIAAVSLR